MPPGIPGSNHEENPGLKRLLLPTKAFNRSARKLTRKNPQAADDLRTTLELLAEDTFDPALKTHKLKGRLAGSWACSAGYDLRVVFQFVKHKDADALLLEVVGTHDEVY
jgi:addiction module RelE/StbE family toxin